MTKMTAVADFNQVFVCVDKYGRVTPEYTLTIPQARELMDSLSVALKAARKEDLEQKKSRLAALQREVAQLEATIL